MSARKVLSMINLVNQQNLKINNAKSKENKTCSGKKAIEIQESVNTSQL
jgi:hypothetical protein